MAALIKEKLGADATLIAGSGGIFEVAIDQKVIAAKTRAGFPTDDAILEAVQSAFGQS